MTEWKDAPCKCGITHPKGSDTYYIGTIQMIKDRPDGLKKVLKCKVCNEALVVEKVKE